MTSPTPAPIVDISSMPRIGDPFFRVWAQDLYTFEANEEQLFPNFPLILPDFLRLTQPEKDFAATMSYFVDQARDQNRVEVFLGTCYGYLFAKWPFTRRGPLHFPWYTSEKKDNFRRELLRCRQMLYIFNPPYDWEVVLSLPDCAFQHLSEELKAKSRVLEETSTDRPRKYEPMLPIEIDFVPETQQGDPTNDGTVSEAPSNITLAHRSTGNENED